MQISLKLTKLQQNEHQLKDKLMKLEWINKEFVHELECREKIFFSTESKMKEFSLIKTNFETQLQSLERQLNQVRQEKSNHMLSTRKSNQNIPADLQGNSTEELTDVSIELENSALLKELEAREKSLSEQLEATELQFVLTKKSYEEERQKLEYEHSSVVSELSNKMLDMESTTTLTVKQLQEERSDIHQEIMRTLQEYHSRETSLKKQIMALEQDMELQASLKRSLSQQLEELNGKLKEAQEREDAFKETIEKADQIVSDVEKGYRERIAILEDNNRILEKRIQSLEEELEEASSRLDDKNDENLLSEAGHMRETIARLEESEHSLRNKVRLLQNERNELLIEVQENEQVIKKNMNLQREFDNLRREVVSIKSSKRDIEDLLKTTTEASSLKEAEMSRALQSLRKERDNLQDSLKQIKKQRLSSTEPSIQYSMTSSRRTSSSLVKEYDSDDSSFL